MPDMVRDDPSWVFHDSLGRAVRRRLRIWHTDSRHPNAAGLLARHLVAVVTERGPGVSITNAAEHVVARILADYPDDIVTVIEHYPPAPGLHDETFDEITLDTDGAVRWQHRPLPEMIAWLGADVLDQSRPLPE